MKPATAELPIAALLVLISAGSLAMATLIGIADGYGRQVEADLHRWRTEYLTDESFQTTLATNQLSIKLDRLNPVYHKQAGHLFQQCLASGAKCSLDKTTAQGLARDAFTQSIKLGSDNDEARIRYLLLRRDQGDLSADFQQEYSLLLRRPLTGVPERILFVQLTTSVWPILDTASQKIAVNHVHAALLSDIKVVNQNARIAVERNTPLLGASFAYMSFDFILANPGKTAFRLVFSLWKYWDAQTKVDLAIQLSSWAETGYGGEIFSAAQANNRTLLACPLLPTSHRFQRFCTDKRLKKVRESYK